MAIRRFRAEASYFQSRPAKPIPAARERGTLFASDEWSWVYISATGSFIDTLHPLNQHLMAVPLLIFKGLTRIGPILSLVAPAGVLNFSVGNHLELVSRYDSFASSIPELLEGRARPRRGAEPSLSRPERSGSATGQSTPMSGSSQAMPASVAGS